MNGTTVRTRGPLKPGGTDAISAGEAEAIARGRVVRAHRTLDTQRVAWTGSATRTRPKVSRDLPRPG